MSFSLNNNTVTVTSRSGEVINNPPSDPNGGSPTATDSNGNQVTVSGSTFTDTLGTTALSVSGTNPLNFSYTPPSGGPASVSLHYSPYTVQTAFGCSGISEYGPTSLSLVSSVGLPDNTSYTIQYEQTPGNPNNVTGRIHAITLSTGGTITYTYTGGSNGITCADGSAAGLTRTTPDGTWQYSRSGTSPAWVTTITDPQSNQTVISFQDIYETQRQVFQGSSTSGTLLKTVTTCYNGNLTNCTGTAVTTPITRRTVTTQLPGMVGQSKTDTYYSSNLGVVTEQDEYDFGASTPTRKTLITYAFWDRPSLVKVTDGAGNIKAQTTISYDQTAVTVTTGTPQHQSVSGSRGNPTTISRLVQGSTNLTQTFTYFDTGNVKSSTDVNGAVANYTYGACGNSFPTQVSLPLSLSRSMAWNCTGGVVTSATDENNQTTSTTYNDPYFWRPAATTDQASNLTNITYPSATVVNSSLSFNGGNSVVESRLTADSLGRPQVGQKRQAPGATNYDSVETDYDSLGRPFRTTMPYSGTAGQTNGTVAATTTGYDALGRPTQTTDAGGGTASFSYSQNDALSTAGPAPTGENTKRRQMEYDALGRLTSVCELTTAGGSGNCEQTTSQTGLWTTYTYDVLNDLLTVAQNAQATAQNRTYTYDGRGRMTSEINPESGTTNYTYDTDATCGTSNGDLVKRIDAVGNTTCYGYDALHRLTSIRYPSGPYAVGTATKCYMNDSATVNGQTMTNAKGRLAEAYTTSSASCPGTGKLTDLGFSYSVRGEVSDVYESAPHSGGYYHVSASYWPHGALNQLSGLPSMPAITYGVDGEGRVSSVSAGSGQNPVTATTYNWFSQPPQVGVTLGSADSDTFTYDANTGRLTQYKFTIGSTPQSVLGNLTWNVNGTLASLGITDPLNAANQQTCNYAYDDMARISSVNCGAVWSQTFGFDPFGNLTKSGSVSFQPTYNTATNRMASLPGFTPGYDANGNTLSDSFHAYNWDAENQPVTIDTVSLSYDALGRVVEETSGSAEADNFQRANGAIGANWAGNGTGNVSIVSNTLQCTTSPSSQRSIYWNANSNTANQYSQVTIGATVNFTTFAPAVRIQTGGAQARYRFIWQGGYYWLQYIWGLANGQGTTLTMVSATAPSVGDVLELTVVGTTLKAYVNGVLTLSATDSSLASGQVGIDVQYAMPTGNAVSAWQGGDFPSYQQIVYGPTGKLALMSGQVVIKAFVPLPAGATAVYASGGLSYYRHADWLGSSRLASTPSRTVYYDGAYAPFGETYAEAGTPDRSFTGQNQDTSADSTTGLYDFLFRQYAQYGRWTSPDPAGLGAVDLTNPQSLNRYAYVSNNPVNAIDPLGLVNLPPNEGGGWVPLGWGEPGWGGNGDWCLSGYEECGEDGGIGGGIIIGGGGGGGGTGGSTGTGSGPNTGGQPPLSGETNGLPNGYVFRPLTIWQLAGLVPIDNWCDFGPCVFGLDGGTRSLFGYKPTVDCSVYIRNGRPDLFSICDQWFPKTRFFFNYVRGCLQANLYNGKYYDVSLKENFALTKYGIGTHVVCYALGALDTAADGAQIVGPIVTRTGH